MFKRSLEEIEKLIIDNENKLTKLIEEMDDMDNKGLFLGTVGTEIKLKQSLLSDLRSFRLNLINETLKERKAKCDHCGKQTPSASYLPYFEHHPNLDFDKYYCGQCYGWD